MTVSEQWGANRGTVHLVLCIVAIVVGVLMYTGTFHVGVDHKAAGVIETSLGILLLV